MERFLYNRATIAAIVGCFLVLLLIPGAGWCAAGGGHAAGQAERPLQFVERNVNKVIALLRSCRGAGKCSKEQKRQRLSAMADEIFDFDSIARRALGRNVHKFSRPELQRFTQEFATMLKNYYINKIDAYSGEKVAFDKEVELAPGRYQVNTKVIMSDKEIPIIYKLEQRGRSWKVYDVLIEGVSMVKNYRSQFDRILRRKRPAYLIGLVEKKNSKSVYR